MQWVECFQIHPQTLGCYIKEEGGKGREGRREKGREKEGREEGR